MKVLLDTHAFLWAITDESRLSTKARAVIANADSWFSVASVWEVVVKVQSGKLSLPQPVGEFLTSELALSRVQILPIALNHVLRVESLALHHRDPFDRILIAQSLEEKLPLVTADPLFDRYRVELIW
ncbi:MAG TPA: type II toxin-antitoxin system VapC family toxin [Nitrospiraceae bacterium]|nr:type II toxin-antitoxin system VapC family toxin [Nitrospiraceae bacterium]